MVIEIHKSFTFIKVSGWVRGATETRNTAVKHIATNNII